MRVEVLKNRFVRLHSDGMPPFTVHGEAILEGIKVPHDEDEWWVVFPAHGGRGLSMEELLTAYWDGKVLSWDMQLDGTEYNTFG